ncbi:rCG59024, partial [Rattus norvegicus]
MQEEKEYKANLNDCESLRPPSVMHDHTGTVSICLKQIQSNKQN